MGLFSSQIPLKKMVALCRQLSTSYDAGIPIIRSFDLLGRELKDKRTQEVLFHVRDSIRNGATLGEAAQAQEKYFPPIFVQLLSAGEHGGKLDAMLRDLADYFEFRLQLRNTIIGNMIYPVILAYLAMWIGGFALGLIGRYGVEGIFAWVNEYAFLQLKIHVAALAAIVIIGLLYRAGTIPAFWQWFTTYIWPLSAITRRLALSRFFRGLSLLIGSGVPIIACIQRAAAVTANSYIERDLVQAVPKVREGHTLDEAFRGSKFIPLTAREMLRVGEQSGKMELQLQKVSDWYMEEAKHAAHVLTTVLYYVIYLMAAVLVGYIVISFYTSYIGGIMNEIGI